MKKILFIAPHRKGRAPGQRFRFEQYINYLQENDFECTISNIIDEKEDKYFYQYYVYYKQGCYTGTCHWYERDYVNNNISNKELGHHIIEQMNSVKGQSFKKWTKYIWDGSTWINNKTKK